LPVFLGSRCVHLQFGQFCRKLRKAVCISVGPAKLKRQVLSFRVAQLTETSSECFDTRVA